MNAIAEQVWELRDSGRRNMFLGAILGQGSERWPVKIRNMSPLGVLIDSPTVPQPNSPVELTRGRLVAEGRVVWSESKRCGIRFSSQVSIEDWLAPVQVQLLAPAKAPRTRPQAGDLEPATPALATVHPAPGIVSALPEIANLVEQVARTLARDPQFLRNYMPEGRKLICAMQMLTELCGELTAQEPSAS